MVDNPAVSEKQEAHLLDYWRTIWRGRWTVLSIFVIVVTLVALGTFTQEPVYRATATVEISPQSRKVSPVAEVVEMGSGAYGWYAEERYYNTQYEIIKSRDVAQRVFDRLDLYSHPAFAESKDPVGALTKMVDIRPVQDTGIVEISLEGPDPKEVASWVNAIAESYVGRNLDQAIEATKLAVDALLREIGSLRQQLAVTQEDTFDFAERADILSPESQQRITSDRLIKLQADLTETQLKEAEAESVLRRIGAVRENRDSYESIPQIINDPVIQDLYREKVKLEREYGRLLVSFRDKHIRVQEKKSEIDKINQKITDEVERIISNLRTEFALLKEHERSVVRSIEKTRAESLQANRKASGYELVRGEATETKRIYDLISTRVKEIGLSASLLNNNLRILDVAPVPTVPVKPRVVLNLAVGVLLGLLLGVGMVFFLDYLDNTIRTSEDIEHFLKLNLLAVIPKQTEATGRAVREAYQTLRTSLLFSRKNREANAVLVTSAGPREGKSCTVANVARTFAQSGDRVVVLDCDLRRPTIHQHLHTGRDRGITNYILSSDGDDWQHYLKPTDQPNLFAITCGPIPPNPPDVFANDRFQALLTKLRPEFDWVFIDSPPVVSLADSMILASVSDHIVFVIKHNENDKGLIQRCVSNVRKVNPNVVGAVLNNVDLDRSHYKDYYYVGYYYYGESSPKKGRRSGKADGLASVADSAPGDRIGRSVG
ncbi:MAG: GumC family protein [Acidobacteriota bacterium]